MKKATLAILVCLLILVLAASTVSASDGRCRKWHKVRRGQTLWGISRRYGTTVNCIARANHIKNKRLIYRGQWLCIPKKCKPPPPPMKCNVWYKVKRGDWMYKIARRHNVRMRCVANWNGIWNPSLIHRGQRIYIPCKCR